MEGGKVACARNYVSIYLSIRTKNEHAGTRCTRNFASSFLSVILPLLRQFECRPLRNELRDGDNNGVVFTSILFTLSLSLSLSLSRYWKSKLCGPSTHELITVSNRSGIKISLPGVGTNPQREREREEGGGDTGRGEGERALWSAA